MKMEESGKIRLSDESLEKIDGGAAESGLKVGDHILISKYSGTEVKIDGETHTILKPGK